MQHVVLRIAHVILFIAGELSHGRGLARSRCIAVLHHDVLTGSLLVRLNDGVAEMVGGIGYVLLVRKGVRVATVLVVVLEAGRAVGVALMVKNVVPLPESARRSGV
jgi:hypothetical protein